MAVYTLLGSDAPDRINFVWFILLNSKVHAINLQSPPGQTAGLSDWEKQEGRNSVVFCHILVDSILKSCGALSFLYLGTCGPVCNQHSL